MKSLIAFVGTGDYQETDYAWPERGTCRTRYASCALARLWGAERIHLLATAQAWAAHGEGLGTECARLGLPAPAREPLPDGRTLDELWEQFEALRRVLEAVGGGDAVLVDITHGFRAQPFFAGAALSVLQAAGALAGDVAVAYGEYRAGESESPVWELTLFVELIEWAQALRIFLDTGVAGPVVALGRRAAERERARVRAAGSRDFPRFGRLVGAIEAFADDLATLRVASLVTGFEQEPRRKPKARSSARALLEAIAELRAEVEEKVPPLALILARIEADMAPLAAPALHGAAGQEALAALARHYLERARYPEAAVVVREARVSRHAEGPEAVEVNAPGFDDDARHLADQRFARQDPAAREVAQVRNDMEHGGFRSQPQAAGTLRERVGRLVERLEAEAAGPPPAPQEAVGRTYLVTRHPGARDWAAAQGVAADEVRAHLDVADVRPGDTVVGTLPVNLAAAVCARGARYLHLTLELPAALRGRELSAAELEAHGARLEAYRVESVP